MKNVLKFCDKIQSFHNNEALSCKYFYDTNYIYTLLIKMFNRSSFTPSYCDSFKGTYEFAHSKCKDQSFINPPA